MHGLRKAQPVFCGRSHPLKVLGGGATLVAKKERGMGKE
jgi:hypothetical protein